MRVAKMGGGTITTDIGPGQGADRCTTRTIAGPSLTGSRGLGRVLEFDHFEGGEVPESAETIFLVFSFSVLSERGIEFESLLARGRFQRLGCFYSRTGRIQLQI